MADDKKNKTAKSGGASEMPNGDSIRFGKEASSLSSILLGVGVVSLAAAAGIGGGPFTKDFQHAYLVAYMWGLSIAVGAVWWVTLQHLFGARASVVMRRSGELMAQGTIIMAVLSLPLWVPALMHNDVLFPWVSHEYMESNHALHLKVPYLNTQWFSIRMVAYFAYFIGAATFWLKKSLKQDGTQGDVAYYKKLQGQSAPVMIGFALSVTFIAIDLVMSLDPIWFSTIFGVYYFATCVITFHSVLVIGLLWAQKHGRLSKSVTPEHFHDLGKMMFAFTCFWTYIAFSQFMLIWYANIPEETHWFHDRLQGNWFNASLLLGALHFVIPFFGMMSRSMKRNTGRLRAWAVYQLAICWFDMYWLVAPNHHKAGVAIGPVEILSAVGVLGLLIGFVLLRAKNVNLVAVGDPRLKRSIAFQNI